MLHSPGQHPHGALAPVRALWIRVQDPAGGQGSRAVDRMQEDLDPPPEQLVDPDEAPGACRLWLWVHAAAFASVLEALEACCAGEMGGRGWVVAQRLDGKLRRFELVGPEAESVLRQALAPAPALTPAPAPPAQAPVPASAPAAAATTAAGAVVSDPDPEPGLQVAVAGSNSHTHSWGAQVWLSAAANRLPGGWGEGGRGGRGLQYAEPLCMGCRGRDPGWRGRFAM